MFNGGSLVELLRFRARMQPDDRAFVFLRDGEHESDSVSYAELDRRSRTVAAELRGRVSPGARALLLYPPGLEFVAAFFGCLYARVVAVPAFPPRWRFPDRYLARALPIADDARPEVVLSTSETMGRWARAATGGSAPHRTRFSYGRQAGDPAAWVATDTLDASAPPAWRDPRATPRTLAFLQYTSGSTASRRRPAGRCSALRVATPCWPGRWTPWRSGASRPRARHGPRPRRRTRSSSRAAAHGSWHVRERGGIDGRGSAGPRERGRLRLSRAHPGGDRPARTAGAVRSRLPAVGGARCGPGGRLRPVAAGRAPRRPSEHRCAGPDSGRWRARRAGAGQRPGGRADAGRRRAAVGHPTGRPSGARVSGGARRRGGGGRRRRPVGAGAAPAPGSDRAPRSPSPRARALRRAGRTPAASHARLLRHVAERLTRRVGPGAGAAGRRGADRCDGGPRGVVGRPRRRRTRRSCRDPRGLVRTGGRPQAPTVDRPRRHVREHGRDDAAVAGVGQPRETPSRGVGRRFADSDPAYARRVGRDLVARARGLAAHPHPQRLQSAERRNS